jgi:hypothetical protein
MIPRTTTSRTITPHVGLLSDWDETWFNPIAGKFGVEAVSTGSKKSRVNASANRSGVLSSPIKTRRSE